MSDEMEDGAKGLKMEERFSDRIGVTRPRHELQLGSMDDALRSGLWNWVAWALDSRDLQGRKDESYWYKIAPDLWDAFFRKRRDGVPTDPRAALREWFQKAEWYEVYNLIQFLYPRVNQIRHTYNRHDNLPTVLNQYLERDLSGYRLIGGMLVPITSPAELDAIREAATPRTGFEGVSQHINTALEMLAKKPTPDYRNSIKESISAVEAAAKLLTGGKSGGIDTALSRLDKKHHLHPVFKVALSKLYAYTSDEDGIRHSILDSKTEITAADGKFMLVVCSGFANYLLEAGR